MPSSSFNSSSSSTERLAKLLTKLSGFLISWAMPAVSWPNEAIFSAWIRLAWAALRSRRVGFGGVPCGTDFRLDRLRSVMSL